MAITKIEIIGLFNKYNVLLDLSKRCNILVGANGIGKSTTLKIIAAIYNSNWIEVSRFPFKHINLALSDGFIYSFSRIDLFPSVEEIKKFISNKYDNLYKDFLNEHWVLVEKENCLVTVDELIKSEQLCDFLANCQNNIKQPIVIQRIIRTNYKVRSNYSINFEELLLQAINHFKNKSYYNSSRIINLVQQKQIISQIKEKSFFLDMVRSYEVDNKSANKSEYISPLIKWMALRPNDFYDFKPHKTLSSLMQGIRTDKMFGQLINCLKTPSRDFVKEIFLNINDFEVKNKTDHTGDFFLRELSEKSVIQINRLINQFYYTEFFVISFNKRALESFANCISDNTPPIYSEDLNYISNEELNYEQIKVLKDFFNNNKVAFNIENFINPILCEGSPFIFDIDDILENINNIDMLGNEQYYLKSAHWEFYKFYNAEIDELINPLNKSEEMLLFEEIICEYLQINAITICPSGMLLTVVNTEIANKYNLEIFRNHENSVDLSLLSSGEKKILLLISLSIFVKDITIIVDEPELSLSLIWQEKILPDILNRTNLKKIIVATHSPYIASDESLTDYIAYLPNGKVDTNEYA